jgi:transcription initiation factor TFIIE subunit alpha
LATRGKKKTLKNKKINKKNKKIKPSKAPKIKKPRPLNKPGTANRSRLSLQNDKTEETYEVKKASEDQQKSMQKVIKILGDSNVRQNLIEIGGENALAIVRNFYGNHSDEEIAKKLKIKISDVRATLNKLHNEGLVNYMREKDSETGWYSYSWSLNQDRMIRWASTQTNKLNSMNGENNEEYYFCPACGMSTITNFESAVNVEFKCERCSRLLEFIDEKKMNELYEKSK